MSDFSTEVKTVKARVEHYCCCYERVVESGYGLVDFPSKYHEAINLMKDKKGKIQIGEEHFEWSGFFDGEPFRAKANKEMHSLIWYMDWMDSY